MHYLDVEAVGVVCSLGWKLHCLGFCMVYESAKLTPHLCWVWVQPDPYYLLFGLETVGHIYGVQVSGQTHRFDMSDSALSSLQPWKSRATHLLTGDMFRKVSRKTVGRLALAGIHPTSLHLFH